MNIQIRLSGLAGMALVASIAMAVSGGCDKEKAKETGNAVERGADKTGNVVDRGLDRAGKAANQGIQDANEAAQRAKPEIRAATTQAAQDLGNAARATGRAVERAGDKLRAVAPTTRPTQ
jgi:vacuolar-type H+-ATPase subunit H